MNKPVGIPDDIWDAARKATGGWMVAGEHEVNQALVASVADAMCVQADAVEEALYGRHERGFIMRPLIDCQPIAEAVRSLKAERDALSKALISKAQPQ